MENFYRSCLVFLILVAVNHSSLRAQNSNAIITDLKVFSFFNNEVIADSIHFQSEDPVIGPLSYLEDTLDIFAKNGAFSLVYQPMAETTHIGIWVDLNEDGTFDKEERIYSGQAKEGSSNDTLSFPEFDDSRRAMIALSDRQEDLADPLEIPKNDQLSSVQFIIRAGPPTLVMGSKKDTRDTTENFCLQVPMELFLGPGHPCITVYKWIIEYPVSNSAQVNTNVTLNPGGTAFSVGTMLYANDYYAFDLDFSSFPINDGESVHFIFQYTYCDDPATIESAEFIFTKDCTTGLRKPQDHWNENLDLQLAPNPVDHLTRIEYELDTGGPVQLLIFDATGRQIDRIQNGFRPAGLQQLTYSTEKLPTGIYWVYLRTPRGFITKKMMKVGR